MVFESNIKQAIQFDERYYSNKDFEKEKNGKF